MAGKAPPEATLVTELRQMVHLPKRWVSSGGIAWVDAGGKPKGLRFRESLAIETGLMPATLFVNGYFKPSSVPGAADKLSLSVFYKNYRILGLDEDGPSLHRNSVGIGRPYFQQSVGHPQVHTISDDAIYGYAEPIDRSDFSAYWIEFCQLASIADAPQFSLPPAQQEMKL